MNKFGGKKSDEGEEVFDMLGNIKKEYYRQAKPYEELSDQMKWAIMTAQPKLAQIIANKVNKNPNSYSKPVELR